jgi:RND superfamily putative drug exporter
MLSRLVFVKELGLGVAFAVVIDATIVRGVLVPAVMKVLGTSAWWSPTFPRARRLPVETPVPVPVSVSAPQHVDA